MSLKNFHIFFIVISIFCALGLAAWCFFHPAGVEQPGSRVLGALSLAVSAALLVYGVLFLRKMARLRTETTSAHRRIVG